MTEISIATYRRVLWLGCSAVVAVTLIFFALTKGLFMNSDTRVFELLVFLGAWLAITFLMRLVILRDQHPRGFFLGMIPEDEKEERPK